MNDSFGLCNVLYFSNSNLDNWSLITYFKENLRPSSERWSTENVDMKGFSLSGTPWWRRRAPKRTRLRRRSTSTSSPSRRRSSRQQRRPLRRRKSTQVGCDWIILQSHDTQNTGNPNFLLLGIKQFPPNFYSVCVFKATFNIFLLIITWIHPTYLQLKLNLNHLFLTETKPDSVQLMNLANLSQENWLQTMQPLV